MCKIRFMKSLHTLVGKTIKHKFQLLYTKKAVLFTPSPLNNNLKVLSSALKDSDDSLVLQSIFLFFSATI